MVIFATLSGCAYHKPEYRGKVIDIETGKPIDGAVVAVIYTKTVFAFVDTTTSLVKTREVLSDKNGNFVIPAYTTLPHPFSWDNNPTNFIFYKPGYGGLSTGGSHGECFTENCQEEDFKLFSQEGSGPTIYYRIGPGFIALPPVKTKKQRLYATGRVDPILEDHKKLPKLYDMINSERRKYGLQGIK